MCILIGLGVIVLGFISLKLFISNNDLKKERAICSIGCDLKTERIRELENELENCNQKILNDLTVSEPETVSPPKKKRNRRK